MFYALISVQKMDCSICTRVVTDFLNAVSNARTDLGEDDEEYRHAEARVIMVAYNEAEKDSSSTLLAKFCGVVSKYRHISDFIFINPWVAKRCRYKIYDKKAFEWKRAVLES